MAIVVDGDDIGYCSGTTTHTTGDAEALGRGWGVLTVDPCEADGGGVEDQSEDEREDLNFGWVHHWLVIHCTTAEVVSKLLESCTQVEGDDVARILLATDWW